ncbi:MAG: GlpG protein [Oceanospirillaceae bacterium]|jgi:GlpG protein
MIEVFSTALDEDLTEFTQHLWKLKIVHRVVFDSRQLLLVEDHSNAPVVLELFEHWQQQGSFPENLDAKLQQSSRQQQFLKQRRSVNLKKIPVVLSLLLISMLLSFITQFGGDFAILSLFTITDFKVNSNSINYYSLSQNFESWQLWRFISPIFIHFNAPHIIFNSLWIWIVGSVIEQRQGSLHLLFIALFSGIASNVAQYYETGPVFGGLSGVVYAVITYAWLWDKLATNKFSVVSNALFGFMIVWLVLGYSEILDVLGLGKIANTAHLVGLLCGLLAVPSVLILQGKLFRKSG